MFGPTKTPASVRNIDVAEFVFDVIDEHVEQFGVHKSGLIFTNAYGEPVATSTLQKAWATAAKAVGTTATPHDLRHYFASMQIAGGCSIKKLQALLGHKSAVETWDTYGHLVGDEDDRARSIMKATLGAAVEKSGTREGLIPFLCRSDGGVRMGWPVGRILFPGPSRASRSATIHLRRPLPAASSGPPVHSGGPPSNVHAPPEGDFLTLLQVGFT